MKMTARPPSSEITTPMSGMNRAINRVLMNQRTVVVIRRRRSATSTSAAAVCLPTSTSKLSMATLWPTAQQKLPIHHMDSFSEKKLISLSCWIFYPRDAMRKCALCCRRVSDHLSVLTIWQSNHSSFLTPWVGTKFQGEPLQQGR